MFDLDQSSTIRFQPTASALKILLNNKYFPDDLLDASQTIEMICTYDTHPTLHFNFKRAYLNFRIMLDAELWAHPEQGWMKIKPMAIQLILAEPIFADQLKMRTFHLDSFPF
jgi:hypothetical protein